MKRASYQSGSVVLSKRQRGPDVWVLRYREDDKQKSHRIGTIQKFRTKAAAEKAVAKFREGINEKVDCLTVRTLCDHFEKDDLGARPHTRSVYMVWLRRVKVDLGDYRIDELAKNLPAIEDWMNGLRTLKGNLPLAKKSKLHAKQFLHLLLEFAMKHGHHPLVRNPIQLIKVKGAHTKVRVHTLLTGEQFQALMSDPDLPELVKTIIQVCMVLGLRISEVLGLRWDAVDFENKTIWIRTSSVGKHVAGTKTASSEDEMPMHEDLEAVLRGWQQATTIDGTSLSTNGWVFENMITGRPFWAGIMQQNYLIPAGKKIGIVRLGWHDFRHTYRAMMGELDIAPEMQQKLMRHSDLSMTMDYGRQRTMNKLRTEHAKVVEMLRRKA